MAEDNDVKINITTAADTKGAVQAEKSLEKLETTATDAGKAALEIGKNTNSLTGLRTKVRDLTAALDAAELGTKDYDDALQDLVATKSKLATAETTHTAKLREAETAHGAAKKATGDSGRATLEFSRALEDSQYGIAGVLNNIPGLVQMLGGGAGLAGVISIAAVGITFLVKQLGSLGESADDKKKRLDQLTESAGFLNDALNDYVELKFEEEKAKQLASENAQATATDALTQSVYRRIEAVKKEIEAINQVTKAVAARMTAERELRNAVDPDYDAAALARDNTQAEKQALLNERKVHNDLMAEERKKIEEERRAAAAALAAIDLNIQTKTEALARAKEEWNKVQAYAVPEWMREDDAEAKQKEKVEKLGSGRSVGGFFANVGSLVSFGLAPTGDEGIDRQSVAEANQARQDLGKIQRYKADPKMASRIELLEKQLPDLKKQVDSAIINREDQQLAAVAAIDAANLKLKEHEAAAQSAAAQFDEKAKQVETKNLKEELKISADDLIKEVGELEKAVEEKLGKDGGKEVAALTQQIKEAQDDGVITAEELKAIQAKQREIATALIGLGPEIAKQTSEVTAAVALLAKAQKESAAAVAAALAAAAEQERINARNIQAQARQTQALKLQNP